MKPEYDRIHLELTGLPLVGGGDFTEVGFIGQLIADQTVDEGKYLVERKVYITPSGKIILFREDRDKIFYNKNFADIEVYPSIAAVFGHAPDSLVREARANMGFAY